MTTNLLVERLEVIDWHYTTDQIDGLMEEASK